MLKWGLRDGEAGRAAIENHADAAAVRLAVAGGKRKQKDEDEEEGKRKGMGQVDFSLKPPFRTTQNPRLHHFLFQVACCQIESEGKPKPQVCP